jgi:hypothetical protein
MMRSAPTIALGLALVLGLGACGYQGPESQVTASTATEDGRPPGDAATLAELFDPMVEELGLRFTRGSLSIRDESYAPSPDGDHLALYVEPIDETTYDADDYAEAIGTLAAAVTPYVFDSFGALASYDICQEPPPAVDDSEAPAPYTQLFMTRSQYDRTDWSVVDTAAVIAESERQDDPILLHVTAPIMEADIYAAALAEATDRS